MKIRRDIKKLKQVKTKIYHQELKKKTISKEFVQRCVIKLDIFLNKLGFVDYSSR